MYVVALGGVKVPCELGYCIVRQKNTQEVRTDLENKLCERESKMARDFAGKALPRLYLPLSRQYVSIGLLLYVANIDKLQIHNETRPSLSSFPRRFSKDPPNAYKCGAFPPWPIERAGEVRLGSNLSTHRQSLDTPRLPLFHTRVAKYVRAASVMKGMKGTTAASDPAPSATAL